MANDPQLPPDPEVFAQHRTHIGIDIENFGEIVEPENLEIADEAKQDTHEEEDRGSVEPGT